MRKYLGRKSYGDAFGSLGQQQGEFYRKFDRFLVAPVVRVHPFGGFRIEHDFQREFGKPCFYVPCSCIRIAGDYVSPVSLAVDEQSFLAELYQCPSDGTVPVRMVFHGFSDQRGDFGISPVIDLLHGMEYSPLHWFKSVAYVRDGSFKYDV